LTAHRAAIGLGSNLGDRRATLKSALARLNSGPLTLLAASPLIETAAVGGPPQPDFLNAAALVQTALEPFELLELLLSIEAEHGRVRGVANGPRTLDLDLLLFDQLVLDRPGLTLPHPRMHLRRFVLEPLAAIAPEWVHPVLGRSAAELLAALDT